MAGISQLHYVPEDRNSKQLFNQGWNIKPRRGRQRKVWSRIVDDLFKSLDIDIIRANGWHILSMEIFISFIYGWCRGVY